MHEKSIELSSELATAERSDTLERYREITNGILNGDTTHCGETVAKAVKRQYKALGCDTDDIFHKLQHQIPRAWTAEYFPGLRTGTIAARNRIHRVLTGEQSAGHFCTLAMAVIFPTAEMALRAIAPEKKTLNRQAIAD
jgi:hypothetical protein